MYVTVRDLAAAPARRRAAGRPPVRAVSGTVVLLGLTSLATDLGAEMVVAVLPIYLTLQLGLGPLAFGVVDGIYQGATALARLGGGVAADRWRRPKAVAVLGYALSAVFKLGLLATTSLSLIGTFVAVDRVGKGLRTAPRDALIAAHSRPDTLGLSFGVHRALDTVGAAGGPLLAFALLAAAPRGYDAVFVASFALAVVGLAILVLFVRDRPGHLIPGAPPPDLAALRRLCADPAYRRVVVVAGLLGLTTISDGFVYLALLGGNDLAAAAFPLLYAATSAVYLALAVPLGRLADRVGRRRVFLAGHLGLLAAYVVVAGALGGWPAVLAAPALLGVYYAATDGVLAALAAGILPAAVRTTGLAGAQTAASLGRLVAAFGFGLLWVGVGRGPAFAVATGALLTSLAAAALLLRGGRPVRVTA